MPIKKDYVCLSIVFQEEYIDIFLKFKKIVGKDYNLAIRKLIEEYVEANKNKLGINQQ